MLMRTSVFMHSMAVWREHRNAVGPSSVLAWATRAICPLARSVVARIEERIFGRFERHFATFEHRWRWTSGIAVAEVAIARRYARDFWRVSPVSSAQITQVRLGACAAHRRRCVVIGRERLTVFCQTYGRAVVIITRNLNSFGDSLA